MWMDYFPERADTTAAAVPLSGHLALALGT